MRRVGRRVVRIEVYGLPLGSGYRLLLDYPRVGEHPPPRAARTGRSRRSVVFGSVLPGCCAGWAGLSGRLSAFYHSDLVETWVVPWANRGRFRGLQAPGWPQRLGWLFYRIQRAYDVTIVTSRAMAAASGAPRRHAASQRIPLGVDRLFLSADGQQRTAARADPAADAAPDRSPPAARRRAGGCLFVGRLIAEKASRPVVGGAARDSALCPASKSPCWAAAPTSRSSPRPGGPAITTWATSAIGRQLAEIYRQHDILLAPGPYETFGLAVLEAMACGLVVVGPDRGGTAELLAEAHSPFVFRAGDVADFVRVVAGRDAADLVPHRRRARSVARRYGTWDEAIGRLMAFYERRFARPSPDPRRPAAHPASAERPAVQAA